MKVVKGLIIKRMKLYVVFLAIVFSLFLNELPSLFSQRQIESYGNIEEIERELFNLLNRERKKRGLNPLLDNKVLSQVSLEHSLKMAGEERLSHTFPSYNSLEERLKEAGLFYVKAGENVAFSPVYVVGEIHRGFMESRPHRENIIDPDFTHCSIRIVKKNNDLYITQEFAQLYTPLQEYEIVLILEQELAAWFKKKFKFRLTLLPTVREFAESCAKENLMGRKASSGNEKWGSFFIVNILSPKIAELKKELKKQVRHINFHGAAVGAAVGIHPNYPGGAYSVTVLLFPGNKYWKKSDEQLRKYVLEEVNKIRNHNRCRRLKYSKVLSARALEAAQLYYNYQEETFRYPDARQILVFQTYDPRGIPPDVEDFLTKHKRSGKVGIAVFSPLKYGLPGNFFIVAIIVSDL